MRCGTSGACEQRVVAGLTNASNAQFALSSTPLQGSVKHCKQMQKKLMLETEAGAYHVALPLVTPLDNPSNQTKFFLNLQAIAPQPAGYCPAAASYIASSFTSSSPSWVSDSVSSLYMSSTCSAFPSRYSRGGPDTPGCQKMHFC